MTAKGDAFMWIFVFFDLPVKTKPQRTAATRFRNYLLRDGYIRVQYSVYGRICNGQERVEKHLKRLESVLPKKGSIRALQITDRQYGRMKILLGQAEINEEKDAKSNGGQLLFL